MTAIAFVLRYWRLIGLAVLVVAIGAQTARLHHAKADLKSARAALIDPATHKTWQSEALAASRDLGVCRGNVKTLDDARQAASDSVERLKQEAVSASKANHARQTAAQAASRDDAAQAARIMATRASGDLCASAVERLGEP